MNIILNWDAISMREGMAIPSDISLGVIMVLLVLEAARRSMGWPLPIVAIVAMLYALFGPYFPGMLAHGGFPLEELAPFQYLRTDGIFGVPLGVSASFIFLFVLFGSILNVSGAGQFFIDLSLALTGRSQGGPAKAAVVASALMGTVSGSSVANAVTTGSFTIPLMKRAGYTSEFSGAVVAAASTGGQVMPPVMGAAAFIMAHSSVFPTGRSSLPRRFPRRSTSSHHRHGAFSFRKRGSWDFWSGAAECEGGLPRGVAPAASHRCPRGILATGYSAVKAVSGPSSVCRRLLARAGKITA
jgi:hypothetical protein